MPVLRKLLLTVMVLGAITSTVSAGTYASFSATTTNTATFASGTLDLTNDGPTAGVCVSTGGGSDPTSNSGACDQLFALSVKRPGDSAFVDVTLTNSGSVDATTLKLDAGTACAPGNAPGAMYNGSGNPCTVVQVYVQEYSTLSNRTNDTRTPGGTCHYGAGTTQSCDYVSTKNLDTFDAVSPITIGTLTSGQSRYFRIYLQMLSTANNTFQGKQATFAFNWAITT